ncbi:hypothetical protein ACIP97_11330 [Peribacillus frigoritolerans]|uniref:hypothetical protein n=2 Tax=Peribacillus TaxID=2675229 RepID=UPI0038194600
MFLKRNYLRLIGAEVRDSCGSSGTGETPQAFTPRRLTARTKESEHLEGKSTTTHYLVNSNKVCENSLYLKNIPVNFRNPFLSDYCLPSRIKEAVVSRLASNSAGVSQICSIQ